MEWDRPLHSQIAEASEAAVIYQAGHDLIVQQIGPPWRVTALQPQGRLSVASAATRRQQPSKLLRTHYEVVEFTGRTGEEAEFTRWRDSDEAVRVRLLYAPGGEGKTRFARHLGRTWRTDGWVTLEAHHTKDTPGDVGAMPAVGDDATGLLILVDYAERWPEEYLVEFLRQSKERWRLPLRFLLLSRPAGIWWEQFEYLIDKELDLDAEAIRLAPLGARTDERERAFFAARDAYAARLDVPDPEAIGPPPGLTSHQAYSLILTIHMAALAAVDAHHRGDCAPEDPARLSAYLLKRERDLWRNLQRGKRLLTDAVALEHTVYAASLCGPMRHHEADQLLVLMGFADGRERAHRLVADHSFCYPAPEALNGTGYVLEPLQPDRLAEDFIALSLPGHDSGFTAQAWAADAVLRLLEDSAQAARRVRKGPANALPEPSGNEAGRGVRAALTILIEMATRWDHVAVHHLAPFLKAHPRMVLECANASLAALADNPRIGLDTLQALAPVLRGGDGKGLGTGAAAILGKVLDARLQTMDNPVDRAALCRELTAVYQSAGLFDQAVGSARKAAALLRPLVEAEPDKFSPALADSLLGLCAVLTEQGNHAAAAEASAEALKLRPAGAPAGGPTSPYDVAESGRPGAASPFEAALAGSLVRHAEWLFYDAGDPGALTIGQEAMSLLRRVPERGPNRRMQMAHALHSQTGFLLRTAELEAALRMASRSVSEHRDLFRRRESVLRAERLVQALALMSAVQASLRQTSAAARSASEAISLARQVVAADEQRTALLAHALRALADSLSHHSPAEAVTASAEALRLLRSLAKKDARHREAQVIHLATHATHLLRAGQTGPALTLSRESLSLIGDDTASVDTAVLPRIHGVLADVLRVHGDLDAALDHARQAAEAGERLAERLPWLGSELAQWQGKVADILLVKEDLSDAVAMARTALRTYAGFRQAFAPLPELDTRLTTSLVSCLVRSGDLKASMRGMRRLLALNKTGAAGGKDMPTLLALAALHQWAANRREDAADSAQSAVYLFRAAAATRPGAALELASALELHGRMAMELGRCERGLTDLQEAQDLLKTLHEDTPDNVTLTLVRLRCLNSLGLAYHGLSRDEEARTTTQQAIELIRAADLAATVHAITVEARMIFTQVRVQRGVELSKAAHEARTALALCATADSTDFVEQKAELVRWLDELKNASGIA